MNRFESGYLLLLLKSKISKQPVGKEKDASHKFSIYFILHNFCFVYYNNKFTIEMESDKEYADSSKTPRRSRRRSVTESNPASHIKRSIRKTILPEIQETENAPGPIDPVTPSRSIKVLDLEILSQSDALPSAKTPRRSVRKPEIQDTENDPRPIDPVTPSRSVKVLDFETSIQSDVLSTAQTPRRSVRKSVKPVQEYENIVAQKGLDRAASSSVENGEDTERKWVPAVIGRVSRKRGRKAKVNKKKQLKHQEKIEEVDQVTDVEVSAQIDLNDENDKKEDIQENKKESEKVITLEFSEEENNSIEGGDIIMSKMPITADDCMESAKELVEFSKDSSPMKNSTMLATNDDSDCVMLSFNESSHSEQLDNSPESPISSGNVKSNSDNCESIEIIMPPLLVCSDDEEEFYDVPNKSDEKNNEEHVIASPKKEHKEETEEKLTSPLNGTFDADDSSQKNNESIDPQPTLFRPSITRIPTPYKSKKAIVPDILIEPEEEMGSNETHEILIEPKEGIQLKSSRKRSFSICTDRPKKVVTFHSPSNTTVSIYEGDLMKSPTKEESNKITNRRKRSLSVAETDKEVLAYFKHKKITETSGKQSKLPQPSSRIKMPNFAAIHQHQFQKMESISELIARKAERAKVLSNSAVKVRPASVQKGLPVKNSILRDFNKDIVGNKAMPKARQRIELSGIEPKSKIELSNSLHGGMKSRSKSKQDLTKLDDFKSIGQMSTKLSASTIVITANSKAIQLPKPRFDLSTTALKTSLNSMASYKVPFTATSTDATNASAPQLQTKLPNPRLFNLTTKTDTQVPKTTNKLDDRRKRLMDMYKSRNCPRTGEKNREILKGVRTNRRFELQMQCRNRPN